MADRNIGNSNRDRMLNRNMKKPAEARELDNSQKGIKLFFGEKERRFFQNAGREITEDILQESFILYRIDYKKTRTHDLYGESKFFGASSLYCRSKSSIGSSISSSNFL